MPIKKGTKATRWTRLTAGGVRKRDENQISRTPRGFPGTPGTERVSERMFEKRRKMMQQTYHDRKTTLGRYITKIHEMIEDAIVRGRAGVYDASRLTQALKYMKNVETRAERQFGKGVMTPLGSFVHWGDAYYGDKDVQVDSTHLELFGKWLLDQDVMSDDTYASETLYGCSGYLFPYVFAAELVRWNQLIPAPPATQRLIDQIHAWCRVRTPKFVITAADRYFRKTSIHVATDATDGDLSYLSINGHGKRKRDNQMNVNALKAPTRAPTRRRVKRS